MSCETHCCVLSRGEFYISDWKSSCDDGIFGLDCQTVAKPFKKIGNVSSCLIEIQAEILGKENEFNPLSDTCPRTLINGVNLTLTIPCASRQNLYRALYGEVKAADSGRHVKEFCIDSLSECDFFTFEKQQAFSTNLDVFLVDEADVVLEELVVDVDYKYTRSGIEILRDDIDTTDAVKLRLAYDYNNEDFYDIDFGSKFQGYKTLFFKGTNFNDEDRSMFDAVFHKVLFAPVSQFDLISSNEFLTLSLSGSVEKTNGSWFKITKQEG